jgi:methionine aminopeptidase
VKCFLKYGSNLILFLYYVLQLCQIDFHSSIYLLQHFSEHAEKHGFGVVECFVGHGVGKIFHSEPIIYHQRKSLLQAILLGACCIEIVKVFHIFT